MDDQDLGQLSDFVEALIVTDPGFLLPAVLLEEVVDVLLGDGLGFISVLVKRHGWYVKRKDPRKKVRKDKSFD